MRRALIRLVGFAILVATVGMCSKDRADSKQDGGTRPDAGGPAGGGATSGGAPDGGTGGSGGGSAADWSWFFDEARWTRIDAGRFLEPPCAAYEALSTAIAFPVLEWSSCGGGCSKADVLQGYDFYGGAAHPEGMSMVITDAGWKPLLSVTFGKVERGVPLNGFRAIRLDTGATVGVIKVEGSPCAIAGTNESARMIGLTGGPEDPDGGVLHLDGFVPSEPGAWTWAAPARPADEPYARSAFDVDLPDGDGVMILLGFGAVYKQRTISASDYDVLEADSGSYLGAGQGDLAIWTDYALDHERIRGWAPDGMGVRTIIEEPPDEACGPIPSPTAIVGLTKSGRLSAGSSHCGYPADEVRLWKTARSYGTSGVSLETSSPLALPAAEVELAANWGSYSVLSVVPVDYTGAQTYETRDSERFYVLVELATWRAYRIDPTTGFFLRGNQTLSDEYFYFEESQAPGASTQQVVRIDLRDIEAHGVPL